MIRYPVGTALQAVKIIYFRPEELLLNIRTLELVLDSFEKIMQEDELVVRLLYGRLFELNPAMCALFPADFNAHGRQVLAAIQRVIGGLKTPETILPELAEIGRMHAGMGIPNHYYFVFGEALFWTLGEVLGEAFDEKLALAWMDTYYLLAGLMQETAVR